MPLTVALKGCSDYDYKSVYDSIAESIELIGGIGDFITSGDRVLLKPNLLSANPPDAAVTTHPSIVKAVINIIKSAGAEPVVGDSPAISSTEKVAERCGIAQVCRDTGVQLVNLSESVVVANGNGRTFKRFEISSEIARVDAVVNLPKIKTHVQMLLTMAIKNLFGCIPGRKKSRWHMSAGTDRDYFAAMLLDLCTLINPVLTIADAITGLEGNGPGSGGSPRNIGIIAVSSDCLALDTVMARILGASEKDLPLLRTAREAGIDSACLSNIKVVGNSIEQCMVDDFVFPDKVVDIDFMSSVPYFLRRRFKRSMSLTPMIERRDCVLCSLCVDVCPAYAMNRYHQEIIIDRDRCIGCFCCQEICPEGAIRPVSGFLGKMLR